MHMVSVIASNKYWMAYKLIYNPLIDYIRSHACMYASARFCYIVDRGYSYGPVRIACRLFVRDRTYLMHGSYSYVASYVITKKQTTATEWLSISGPT